MAMSQLFRDYLARVGSPHSGYPVGLVTIAAESSAEPLLRLCSLTDRTVLSRGDTYFPSGFDYRIPDRLSEGDARPAFVLPVSDVEILRALRAHVEQLQYTLEVVFSYTPDVVELGPFRLLDLTRPYETVTQTLAIETSYRDVLRNPRPGRKYTPASYPGLFGSPNLQGVL